MKIHSSVLQSMAIALAITSLNSACSKDETLSIPDGAFNGTQKVVIDKEPVYASEARPEYSKENNQNYNPHSCPACGMG
ncbi:MAG: hypothetical protein IPL35_10125 [Sphingobacteriales bacterium]|nr:hypothetical protein [Sphingobacteriales bacterium]